MLADLGSESKFEGELFLIEESIKEKWELVWCKKRKETKQNNQNHCFYVINYISVN